MEDLKDNYKNLAPVELVKLLWDNSTKNDMARMYCIGAIDALRAVNQITLEEYNLLYNYTTTFRKKH